MDLSDFIVEIKKLKSEGKITESIEFSKKYLLLYQSAELYYEIAECYQLLNLEGRAQGILEAALKKVKNYGEYEKIMNNLNSIYMKHQNKYITYPNDIVQSILAKQKCKKGGDVITFTITSCKRFDLFEKTMNSFLNCCIDLILIDEWICVDDNSSDEDLNRIAKNYPFFKIVKKTESQKGHAKSMNIIKEIVKSPYIFHIEDDWQFFVKYKYITNLLKVLEFEGDKCGQVLVNKNYAELLNINIIGGIPNATNNNIVYLRHEYYKGEELEKNSKRGLNCFYWPHYSLRPSLIRKKVLDDIGHYDESTFHFEMEYANRYVQKGYYSCFLDGIFCKHIGKLTFEKNSEKPNAYVLNGTKQFAESENNKKKDKKIEKYVINLDRRPDRYDEFIKEFQNLNVERFSAIDGDMLTYNSNIGHIFSNNDYNFRKGIIGCALSHIKLMCQLVNSDCDYYVIFEDDAKKTQYFEKMFPKILELIDKTSIDVLFLHTFKRLEKDEKDTHHKIQIMNSKEWHSLSIGSCATYIISKDGANKFLEFLNTRSLTNAIDTEILNAADVLNIGLMSPFLVTQQLNAPDSNIQSEFCSISNIQNYLSLEIDYLTNLGYNIVDDINKVENNSVMIADNKSNNNLSNYKLFDKWVIITNEDYSKLLENGMRLKNENKFNLKML